MNLPPPTELQEALTCVLDCVAIGRDRLSPEAYRWFCFIGREHFEGEITRFTFGDLLRELRQEAGE